MFFFLSKLLPLFFYPVGLSCLAIVLAWRLRERERWLRITLLAAFLAIFLGGNKWVAAGLLRPLEWQHLPPEPLPEAPVIVLLGGMTRSLDYPQQPVPGLNEAGERLLYTAWLYQQGVAPNILVSGGTLGGSTTSEAAEMSWALNLMSVPDEAIWREEISLNTYENAIYTREILDEHGIDEIVLVTSAVHMPRSVMIFENQGFTVIPAPTDYFVVQPDDGMGEPARPLFFIFNFLPDAESLSLSTRALKEYAGIAVYWLRGWL
jgi:uncharacterized SAM-binding protein YcdF (DUF218 family)